MAKTLACLCCSLNLLWPSMLAWIALKQNLFSSLVLFPEGFLLFGVDLDRVETGEASTVSHVFLMAMDAGNELSPALHNVLHAAAITILCAASCRSLRLASQQTLCWTVLSLDSARDNCLAWIA